MSEVGQGLKAMAEALVPQKDDNNTDHRGITGRMGITKTIGNGMQSMSDGFVAMAGVCCCSRAAIPYCACTMMLAARRAGVSAA